MADHDTETLEKLGEITVALTEIGFLFPPAMHAILSSGHFKGDMLHFYCPAFEADIQLKRAAVFGSGLFLYAGKRPALFPAPVRVPPGAFH